MAEIEEIKVKEETKENEEVKPEVKPSERYLLVKRIIELHPDKIYDIPTMFYEMEEVGEEVQLKLVGIDTFNVKYLNNPTNIVKRYVIMKDHESVFRICNLTLDDIAYHNKCYRTSIKLANIGTVRARWSLYDYNIGEIMKNVNFNVLLSFPNMSDELQMELFRYNKDTIDYIRNPCLQLKRIVIMDFPKLFNRLHNKTKEDILFNKMTNADNTNYDGEVSNESFRHESFNNGNKCVII